MRKICTLLLAALLLCSAACKAPAGDEPAPSSTPQPSESPAKTTTVDDIPLTDILYLFDDMTDLELGRSCIREEVTADNVDYHLGAQDFTGRFESAMALSPMMRPSAMELILFRLAPGGDARSFAEQLEAKANPQKWLCVGAETVEAKSSGRTVLFFMGDKTSWNTLSQCFEQICQKDFRVEDHLKDPLADLTAEALYAQLKELYGVENYGFVDGEELSPAGEGGPLGLTPQELKGVESSLIDRGYAPADEFNMERSYLLALFRLKEGGDAAALAARLMAEADLSELKGEGIQTIVAYSGDTVIFFAGGGGYSWFIFDLDQVFQGQYRMTTIQTQEELSA